MDTATTRLGSEVRIGFKDDDYIYGAWDDGTGKWYPMRWTASGHFYPPNDNGEQPVSSLDLNV